MAADKTYFRPTSEIVTQDKMISCENCGVVFENLHDLEKHVKTWCAEQTKRNDEYEFPPSKRTRLDESLDNEDEEQNVYEKIAEMSRENNEEQWQEKVEKYENEGLCESDAKEKATMKMRDSDLKAFVNYYEKLLSYTLQLRHGKVHNKIMNSIENFMEDGVDREKAIRLALRKYKHYFEEYIDSLESDDDDDDDDETNEDSDSV